MTMVNIRFIPAICQLSLGKASISNTIKRDFNALILIEAGGMDLRRRWISMLQSWFLIELLDIDLIFEKND
jgi:hypothetical protein